jgi:hypothetical protein
LKRGIEPAWRVTYFWNDSNFISVYNHVMWCKNGKV